jgi:crotonobetainyl-CoA:carnitine CoA-transferase CaiB-like acyl-CoA transferase
VTEAQGPLHGIRILDLSSVIMGPMATQLLGDLGAEVIAVENLTGDTNRVMDTGRHAELSGVALNLLRNKRNVCVDIKQPAGREVVLKIAATCDVVITNIRPGGLRRARLEYADLQAVRPDIVFCEAHGYPRGTAREDAPAYDDIMQTESGLADAFRRQGGTPFLAPTLIADKVCALTIAYAVCAALVRRERTGHGEYIEVPMIETVRAWMLVEHGGSAVAQPSVGQPGYQRILTPRRRPQQSADGWINVLPYSREDYDVLFSKGGREDLLGDARYETMRARIANSDFLYEQVTSIIATRTTREWLQICQDSAIPVAEVASLDDLVDRLPDAEHPVVGTYKLIPPPLRFTEAPASVRSPAPLIGADTEEVLREVGMLPDEIAALLAAGVVHVGSTAS